MNFNRTACSTRYIGKTDCHAIEHHVQDTIVHKHFTNCSSFLDILNMHVYKDSATTKIILAPYILDEP